MYTRRLSPPTPIIPSQLYPSYRRNISTYFSTLQLVPGTININFHYSGRSERAAGGEAVWKITCGRDFSRAA
jgi:hypothetical protein